MVGLVDSSKVMGLLLNRFFEISPSITKNYINNDKAEKYFSGIWFYLRWRYSNWFLLHDPCNNFIARWLAKRTTVRIIIPVKRRKNPLQWKRRYVNFRSRTGDAPQIAHNVIQIRIIRVIYLPHWKCHNKQGWLRLQA